jgi:hypothetical protein
LRPRSFLALIILAVAGGFSGGPRPSSAAEPFIVEIGMFGNQQVPPVQTVAYGFVRFFFDESRLNADYTVDVKGLSTNLVTGADIRRGARGVEGPVVKHLADGGFIVTAGKLKLTQAELEEMLTGNWYVELRSLQNPEGELRGQITLPAGFLPAPPEAPTPPPPGTDEPAGLTSPLAPAALPQDAPAAAVVESVPPAAVAPPRQPVTRAGEGRISPPSTGSAGLR